MKIWIDIYHIPQFNFYLSLMKLLTAKGHTVYLTVLNRGRLLKIAHNDLSTLGLLANSRGETGKVSIFSIGHHRMRKWSVILEANLLRIIQLGWWRMFYHVDVCYTNGFQAALWNHLFRTPTYTFGDDPDTFDYQPKLHFATQVHFCLVDKAYLPDGSVKNNPHVQIVRCLKEWASLNPRTFTPNVHALDKYGVNPKQYIFLREVSVGTVNYAGQAPQAILAVAGKIEEVRGKNEEGRMKVLFSLEEKHRRNEYPADWILLQEPIEDIHSLMYYAAGLVSSGDSMAREAALLGIPSYYLGSRYSMPANLAASKVANLQNEKTQPFEQWLSQVRDKSEEVRTTEQETLRAKIDTEFIDINQYMLSLVEQLDK